MAHVMNYEELQKVEINHLVFAELKHRHHMIRPLAFNGQDFTNGKHFLLMCECDENECPDYNWNYRIWNEMPTDEEMDNTPWKDDPYV